jgi:hypothetical protein
VANVHGARQRGHAHHSAGPHPGSAESGRAGCGGSKQACCPRPVIVSVEVPRRLPASAHAVVLAVRDDPAIVSVSKKVMPRALRILQAIAVEAERRGYQLTMSGSHSHGARRPCVQVRRPRGAPARQPPEPAPPTTGVVRDHLHRRRIGGGRRVTHPGIVAAPAGSRRPPRAQPPLRRPTHRPAPRGPHYARGRSANIRCTADDEPPARC